MNRTDRNDQLAIAGMLTIVFILVGYLVFVATSTPRTVRLRTSCDTEKSDLKPGFYAELR